MHCLILWIVISCSSALAQHGHEHSTAMGSGRAMWMVGGESFQASIRSVDGGKLTLHLEDGSSKELALAKLDEAHQKRVQGWQHANRAPEGFGEPDRVVRLQTLQGQMRYDQDEIIVPPGAKIRLELLNIDDMHHNLIVCDSDSNAGMDVAQAAWALGGDGFEKQWVPDHPKVLFASRMADPHSTIHGYFTAPEKEGDYPYVCTLPGHAAFMKGTFRVQNTPEVLAELTYMLYHGDFGKLPDFSKLTPVATDHVASGLIDLSVAKRREHFALVFDGILNVPKSAEYRFSLSSDDGSRLEIDKKVVIDHDGVHGGSPKHGKVQLSEGPHPIRVSYFEQSGEESLFLGWSAEGMKESALSVEKPRGRQRNATGIPLVVGDEARIYRNFIEGAGNRAIGVGYPGGINAAFDADQMRLALVWLGGFMDASKHWEGRGQGYQPPLGYGVVHGPPGAPFAALESLIESWPEPENRSTGFQFKGYRLTGAQRLPTFSYHFGDIKIADTLTPNGAVVKNNASLERSFLIESPSAHENLYFRAAAAKSIRSMGDQKFLIDASLVIAMRDGSGTSPVLRENDGQWELLMPVVFEGGKAHLEQDISYLLTSE